MQENKNAGDGRSSSELPHDGRRRRSSPEMDDLVVRERERERERENKNKVRSGKIGIVWRVRKCRKTKWRNKK